MHIRKAMLNALILQFPEVIYFQAPSLNSLSDFNTRHASLLAYQLFFPINAAEKAIVVAESLGWNGELDHIGAIGLLVVGIQNSQHPRSLSSS
jgi:hypothetical protein